MSARAPAHRVAHRAADDQSDAGPGGERDVRLEDDRRRDDRDGAAQRVADRVGDGIEQQEDV